MARLTQRTCGINGCEARHVARGRCRRHYKQLRREGGAGEPVQESHGMSRSPEYRAWKTMISRCHRATDPSYPYYGGRGIQVCHRWRSSFVAFYEDMGPRPEGLTLDRIDGDGDYAPSNCRWASRQTQVINRGKFRGTKYPYIGVIERDNKFVGVVKLDAQRFRTPRMDTLEEAAWMRDQWALAIHGEKASLNFEYK